MLTLMSGTIYMETLFFGLQDVDEIEDPETIWLHYRFTWTCVTVMWCVD